MQKVMFNELKNFVCLQRRIRQICVFILSSLKARSSVWSRNTLWCLPPCKTSSAASRSLSLAPGRLFAQTSTNCLTRWSEKTQQNGFCQKWIDFPPRVQPVPSLNYFCQCVEQIVVWFFIVSYHSIWDERYLHRTGWCVQNLYWHLIMFCIFRSPSSWMTLTQPWPFLSWWGFCWMKRSSHGIRWGRPTRSTLTQTQFFHMKFCVSYLKRTQLSVLTTIAWCLMIGRSAL